MVAIGETSVVPNNLVTSANYILNPSFDQGKGYQTGAYDQFAPIPTHSNWTGQSRFVGAENPSLNRLKWTYKIHGMAGGAPVIASDGTIYFGSSGVWVREAGSDETVEQKPAVYAINADGTKKWEVPLSIPFITSPVIGIDGTVYVSSEDEGIYSIDHDGTACCIYSSSRIISSLALGDDGGIYFSSGDLDISKVHALSHDGSQRWEFTLPESLDCYSGTAIGTDGTVYISADSRQNLSGLGNKWLSPTSFVFALNKDGTKKWEVPVVGSNANSPVIGPDGTIYVFSKPNQSGVAPRLTAVDPNGIKKWEFITDNYMASGVAIASDGTIYFHAYTFKDPAISKLFAINPDGSKKWEFVTGSMRMMSTPMIGGDGTIYAGVIINPDGTKKQDMLTTGLVIGADGTFYQAGGNFLRAFAL